ncbi:S-layer homology domain-containing protein [Sporosarcina sp. 179-K 3D1 HS]|uniref:S-layer homology domain-containing protein n=1 Tax=Sporosarcina sp. 179-K 3D1 HS TaxID=3232169 RepID=UPI00399FF920
MSINSKKSRKFMVGVATAALTATAVAPIASAAGFPDTVGNTHEKAIDALVEAGIIGGYPDGTFQPNRTLTRSDVVKMMGKWLVSLGYDVPSDYKTNPRFTDLTSKTNDELLRYAALVKDNRVFGGYEDGSLGPGKDITRENMAIVLVRAYNAIHKTDLISYVSEQDFKGDVTDLAKAKAEARSSIHVLDYFNITGVTNFRPKESTTRGQFASFLYKASTLEAPDQNVDKEAPKLNYTGEKIIELAKGAAFTMPTVTATDNVDKEVKVETVITNEAGERLTAIDTDVPGTYKITYNAEDQAGNSAEELVITVMVKAPATPAVDKVTALNAKKVQVQFNTEVDKEEAEKTGTYGFVGLPEGTTFKPQLQEDNKTAVLTLNNALPNNSEFSITVRAVPTKADKNVSTALYTQTVAFSDTVRPTYQNVTYPQAGVAVLNFSEEISTMGNVKIYQGNTEATAVKAELTSDNTGIRLSGLQANRDYRVVITGAADWSGNIINPNPTEVTVHSNVTDTAKPEVVSMQAVGLNTLKVKFSEALQEIATDKYVNLEGVTQAQNSKQVWDAATNTVTITIQPITNGGVRNVTVSDYKDLVGNVGNRISNNVTFTDIVPAIERTEVERDNNETYVKWTFNRDMTAADLAGIEIIGTVITPENVRKDVTITGTNNLSVDSNNNKVVRLKMTGKDMGTYNLTLPKATFDPALANDLNVNFTLTPAEDTTVPTVSGTPTVTNRTVTVTYDRDMGQSALTLGNYTVDGRQVFEDAIFNGNKREVLLTLREGTITANGQHQLEISSNVKGENGIAMQPYRITLPFIENIAPTLQSASFNGDNLIELTFNENIKAADGITGLEVLVNNRVVDVTVASTLGTDNIVAIKKSDSTAFVSPSEYDAANVVVNIKDGNKITDVNGNPFKGSTSITVNKQRQ